MAAVNDLAAELHAGIAAARAGLGALERKLAVLLGIAEKDARADTPGLVQTVETDATHVAVDAGGAVHAGDAAPAPAPGAPTT